MTYREKAIERLTSIGMTDVSLMEEIIDLMTNEYYTSVFVDFERETDWNKEVEYVLKGEFYYERS